MARSKDISTDRLAKMLAGVLAGALGEDETRWAEKIGPIHLVETHSGSRWMWAVIPGGAQDDQSRIRSVAEAVRREHPFVTTQPKQSR